MKRMVQLVFFFILLTAGCSPVAFHEKERLADRIMQFDHDAAGAQMRAHMITPREGSIGGFAPVGAGG